MTDEILLAWMAGIFEGEGSVRINTTTRNNNGTLLLDLVNTDIEVVQPFQDRWPGYFRLVAGKGNRRDHWRWRVAARVAAGAIEELLPYLRTARVREKAEIGLAFQGQKSQSTRVNELDDYRERQQAFIGQMRQLNLRGRAAVAA